MKNICCIVNPVSGLKKSLKVYYEAKNLFEKSDFNTSFTLSGVVRVTGFCEL